MNDSDDMITALITPTAPPSEADRDRLETFLDSHANDAERLFALLMTPQLNEWAGVRIWEKLANQTPKSVDALMRSSGNSKDRNQLTGVIECLKKAKNLAALQALLGVEGAQLWAQQLVKKAIKELEPQLSSGEAKESIVMKRR